jgi:CheY-like chemotaxis protein
VIQKTYVGQEERFPTQLFYCDFQSIKRILMNLLGNAIQYGDPSHPIELMATELEQRPDAIKILFEVSNRGAPILREKLDRLFQPFSGQDQRNARSTGLGLSCSQLMVQDMGGEIICSSSQETGETCFSFALEFDTLQPGFLAYKNLRILHVEDDKMTRRTLSALFEEAVKTRLEYKPQQLDIVLNEREALEKFRNCTYDVVISDLHLPGESGIEIAEKIHQLAKKRGIVCPPIIIGTGDQLSKEEQQKIPRELQLSWVHKPFRREVFIREINRRIGRHRVDYPT